MAYKQCFTINPTVRVTAGYPSYPGGAAHGGGDVVLSPNTSIYAPMGGTIIRAYVWTGGVTGTASWGNHILVQVSATEFWLAGHMAAMEMSVGMTLTPGQYIGTQGATGNVTGPHVHWEHWIGGNYTAYRVDPFPMLGIPNALGTYDVEWSAGGNVTPPQPGGDIMFDPPSGEYRRAQRIKISTSLPGIIYYTDNGTYPAIGNTDMKQYTGPIPIGAGSTQFIVGVYNNGVWSDWGYARYTIGANARVKKGMPLWMKMWWY